MSSVIKAIRGMNDILPTDTPYWQLLEHVCSDAAMSYGYQEVRFPIVEQTALFKRTIGEETDIVSKEMYTFEDRNGDSLTLRPEGTAGCVRMGIEQGLLYNQIQRLWYLGPMFRHERPQKGRYRQFHQFGLEAFGIADPAIDAEIIALSYRLLTRLGLRKQVKLELNSLGSLASRDAYRRTLVDYFRKHQEILDPDSKRRLESNPLRILDSKNPELQGLIKSAPILSDYLDKPSREHFDCLRGYLDAMDIPYQLTPHLVRGLDYYGSTVFEWTTDMLGSQGAVCAGGRYDGLVEQLGGKSTPAIGFAMGLERMVLLLQQLKQPKSGVDIYLVLLGEEATKKGLMIAEFLRGEFPGLTVESNVSGGNFKAQFKRADKSGARWAFILGEDEVAANRISIKSLREQTEQITIASEDLALFIQGEI